MRTASLILTLLIAPLVATVGAAVALADRLAEQPPAMIDAPPVPMVLADAPEPEPRVDARLDRLGAGVNFAIEKWPAPSKDIEQVDLGLLAGDIATAAVDDPKPEEAALLLAALAYHEGARFAAFVDQQLCNEWMHTAWEHPIVTVEDTGVVSVVTGRPIVRSHMEPNKASLPRDEQKILAYGDCDSGHAYTLWQIHPGDYGVSVDALRDRVFAARLALKIARRDLSRYTTGKAAWSLAQAALAKHPFMDQ